MNRLHRLARLERSVGAITVVDEERIRRDAESTAARDAAWAIMLGTMSEEHARMVVDAYGAGMQDVRHPDWGMPTGTLLRRCLDALSDRPYWPYTEVPPEVALARPPVVADVYLADRHALPLHQCEECEYRVPHQYFIECPLCAGRVGWYAYWRRHKGDPRTD